MKNEPAATLKSFSYFQSTEHHIPGDGNMNICVY